MTATRRRVLAAGGLMLAGLLRPRLTRAADEVVEIRMTSDRRGAHVAFDPIGVRVRLGQTIRWICGPDNVHTATAYHPANDRHALRIPKDAAPWDSGLLEPGGSFEVTLTVEGVYDYYCAPHELAGMVGRIIVGAPGGPGAPPFDVMADRPEAAGWQPVPEAARRAFPAIDDILARGEVRPR